MKRHIHVFVRRFLRCVFPHRHKWTFVRKISKDGQTVYTLRRCPVCRLTEIEDRRGRWSDVTKCLFSSFPCFEAWHRERYMSADAVIGKECDQ